METIVSVGDMRVKANDNRFQSKSIENIVTDANVMTRVIVLMAVLGVQVRVVAGFLTKVRLRVRREVAAVVVLVVVLLILHPIVRVAVVRAIAVRAVEAVLALVRVRAPPVIVTLLTVISTLLIEKQNILKPLKT